MRDVLVALRLEAWVLPALLAWPLVGALLIQASGRAAWPDPRRLALLVLSVEALLAAALWAMFDPGVTGWQAAVDLPWIARWGARVALGVDGLSLPLVTLTALLAPLALLASGRAAAERPRRRCGLLLLLTSAILGTLTTLDLLLLAAWWSVLVGATFLAVRAGDGARRTAAAWRYLVLAGPASLLMLVAIVLLWISAGSRTFALDALLAATRGALSTAGQMYLLGAFLLAFAAQSALFPLHVWRTGAQREAPTAAAAALAIPVGVYGVLRFALPFFPAAATHPALRLALVAVAVAGLLYCALAAGGASDAARLVACAASAHLALVLLGVLALGVRGVQGALVLLTTHGLAIGAASLLGGMLRDRERATLGGLAGGGRGAPWLAGAFALVALTLLGLPGTAGFVGTRLALAGAWSAFPAASVVAGGGVLLAAARLVRALHRLLAPPRSAGDDAELRDLDRRERLVIGALAVAIVWLGVAPGALLRRTEGAAQRVVEQVTRGAAAAPEDVPGR